MRRVTANVGTLGRYNAINFLALLDLTLALLMVSRFYVTYLPYPRQSFMPSRYLVSISALLGMCGIDA